MVINNTTQTGKAFLSAPTPTAAKLRRRAMKFHA
jgi:hypothetical protein